MNYYKLQLPVFGRFVEEYISGYYDKSWCVLHPHRDKEFSGTLKARRKQRFDTYWFMPYGGFEMAVAPRVFDILFSNVRSSIEVVELSVIHPGKEEMEPETICHVNWVGDLVPVDEERMEALRDKEVPVGGNMRFIDYPNSLPGGIGKLDYFHASYIVSQEICDRLVLEKVQQISLIHIDRVPMDSGDMQVKYKNNVNRLIEQGLTEEQAVAHIANYARNKVSGAAIKKWRDGKYQD